MHSNYARKIVNELAIANLQVSRDTSAPVNERRCVVSKENRLQPIKLLNKSTVTFALVTSDGEPIPEIKNFNTNLEVFGKHFRIQSLANRGVYRQYTICNSMNPLLNDELIRCLKQGSVNNFNFSLINDTNFSKYLRLTVKEYDQSHMGMSRRFFRETVNQA